SLVTVYTTSAGQSAPGGASAKPAADGVGEGVGADEASNDGVTDGETATAGGVHAAVKTIAARSFARMRSVSPWRPRLSLVDRVYLDHAATTPVDPEVAEAMARVLRETHGNPSSIYAEGRAARAAVDRARDEVAAAINAEPGEIVFTSGGTESDNLALRGALKVRRDERDGLVTTAIEHHAVIDTARDPERHAHVRVDIIGVDRNGIVDPEAIRDAIDERTSLVSVMHANNEIGTIEPIAEIGALCRDEGVTFHSDAVQTVGALEVDVRKIPVDLLSINAHKFYGPKGVGALYVRRGTRLATMQTGGGQEKGRRTGTENVAGVVGLGVAMRIARERRATESPRQATLRDHLIAVVRAR